MCAWFDLLLLVRHSRKGEFAKSLQSAPLQLLGRSVLSFLSSTNEMDDHDAGLGYAEESVHIL